LGGAVNGVGDWDTAAEERRVFDVVDTEYDTGQWLEQVWRCFTWWNTLGDIAFDTFGITISKIPGHMRMVLVPRKLNS